MSVPQWVTSDQIFDGARLRGGAVCVLDGRVAEVADAAPAGASVLRGIMTPGFVDLQVNGGGGVLFNATPTVAGLGAIAAAHRQFGTVAILPTVITDAAEVLERATDAVLAAQGMAGILGLHIEGPHISPARRGTHAARHVRPMEPATIAQVRRLRQAGMPVMITLAPEAATAAQIAELAALGAVVSIGHSDATAAQTRAALATGASCFTHLFNAMSPMLNRAPGVTGAAIGSRAYAGVICDGHHVADEMIALALRARPAPDLTFVVSDAMPTVGGAESFELYGSTIRLSGGKLVNDEGSLAGAHVTMAMGVARLVSVLGLTPEAALRMAVTVPARVMGVSGLAQLVGCRAEDVVMLGPDMQMTGTLAAQLPMAV